MSKLNFSLLATVLWRFRKEAKMVWLMLTNAQVPTKAKLIALAGVAYLISPIDIIPDFLLGVGWLDDFAIVSGFLWLAYKFLPTELYEQLRNKVNGQYPRGAEAAKEAEAAEPRGQQKANGQTNTAAATDAKLNKPRAHRPFSRCRHSP